jgi:SulP family sulfate permease
VAPFFGGIPATGAIARTATNVKSGGRTPVAGITHALTVLLITLVFGSLAQIIPLATLAGILLLVSYRMIDWRVFRAELRGSRSDAAVLVTVFVLTLLVDLTAGIGVGVVLASLLFVRRMATIAEVRVLGDDAAEDLLPRSALPRDTEVYEIQGPLFFGVADQFKDVLAEVSKKPRVLIIRMRHVPFIDSTGLNVLRDLIRRAQGDGTIVILAEVQDRPMGSLGHGGIVDLVGAERVAGTLDAALTLARAV